MAKNHAKSWRTCRSAALGGLLVLAAGCDLPGKPNPDDRPLMPDQIVNFEVLYRQNCSGCHGRDGQFGPAPPLNDPLFLAIISKEELLRVIRDGRRSTPMPAFAQTAGGSLTDAQVNALAAGIQSRWKSAANSAEPLPDYRLTKADDLQPGPGNRERGADVFARACAGCHGPEGRGEDAGGGAIHDPAFLALISDQALRRIIITGRPDLGMPTYAETEGRAATFQPLTSDQIDDLVALFAAWRATGEAVASTDKP